HAILDAVEVAAEPYHLGWVVDVLDANPDPAGVGRALAPAGKDHLRVGLPGVRNRVLDPAAPSGVAVARVLEANGDVQVPPDDAAVDIKIAGDRRDGWLGRRPVEAPRPEDRNSNSADEKDPSHVFLSFVPSIGNEATFCRSRACLRVGAKSVTC